MQRSHCRSFSKLYLVNEQQTKPMNKPSPTPSSTKEAFDQAANRTDTPVYSKRINPHRSLSNQGFFATIMFTACAFLLPLLAFLGTHALWTLLFFVAPAVAALWYFIRRNDKDGTLYEEVRLWPDLIAVHRMNPRKADQYWHANPYWVTVHMRDTKKCPSYLTLKGAGREIELGAFLSEDERKDLEQDLRKHLAQVANMAAP